MMRTGDKELVLYGGIAVFLILVWALLRNRNPLPAVLQNAAGGGIPEIGSPYGFPVPGFPQTAVAPMPVPAPIVVNASASPFGWIAPYFPLFGFVGIDATQIYQ